MEDEDGENPQQDVQKMIAEEQRRQQKERMEQMLAGIKELNEKSLNDTTNMEEIRELCGYKYPVSPGADKNGRNIYQEVLARVDSYWQIGELDNMKQKSRSRSRQNSPKNPRYQRATVGQINVKDYKETQSDRDCSVLSQTNNHLPQMLNTARVQGQGQGG